MRHQPAPRSNRPMCESLEGRRLLSADGTAVLKNGALRVRGTDANDAIVVALDAADTTKLDVSLNGSQNGQVDAASVRRGIRIDGGAGNDTIRIDETNG